MTDDINADDGEPAKPNDDSSDTPIFDMKRWRKKAREGEGIDLSKKGRKSRHKNVDDSVDRRSLRATGRAEPLNFKATVEIMTALRTYVGKGKISLWLEEAIIAKFKGEGIELDA